MLTEIPKADDLAKLVFSVSNEKEFQQIALLTFASQFQQNQLYCSFCKAVGRNPSNVDSVEQIPYLPIQFFKSHQVKTGEFEAGTVFKSSGTTGAATSFHFVKNTALYEQSFLGCFKQFYGEPSQFCILGLLPSYLEQGSSSLVYMVDRLIHHSSHPQSGFYLYEIRQLHERLKTLEKEEQKTVLFGVTYALLDFAEQYPLPLHHTIVMETGGMKGRKRELAKPALYEQLRTAFATKNIHSEYGMTELLSQAYAINGMYRCPPWMKIILRDETDPFSLGHRTGVINVIDLANIYSCSFIATDDLGRMHADGSFEVLGRMDNADIRGCSQLVL